MDTIDVSVTVFDVDGTLVKEAAVFVKEVVNVISSVRDIDEDVVIVSENDAELLPVQDHVFC